MAAISTIVAVAGLAVGAVSTYSSIQSGKKAAANAEQANAENRQVQAEQRAAQAQQAAQERRQQIREERIKQARILQAAENSGASGSSGEMNALDNLSTRLNSNLALNNSAVNRGNRIGQLTQSSTDFMAAAQSNINDAANTRAVASMAGSLFQASGMLFKNPTKPTTVDNSIFSLIHTNRGMAD